MSLVEVMQFGKKIDRFENQHPRVIAFLKENYPKMKEGAVLELKLTSVEGESSVTNMRLTAEDVDIIETIRRLKSK